MSCTIPLLFALVYAVLLLTIFVQFARPTWRTTAALLLLALAISARTAGLGLAAYGGLNQDDVDTAVDEAAATRAPPKPTPSATPTQRARLPKLTAVNGSLVPENTSETTSGPSPDLQKRQIPLNQTQMGGDQTNLVIPATKTTTSSPSSNSAKPTLPPNNPKTRNRKVKSASAQNSENENGANKIVGSYLNAMEWSGGLQWVSTGLMVTLNLLLIKQWTVSTVGTISNKPPRSIYPLTAASVPTTLLGNIAYLVGTFLLLRDPGPQLLLSDASPPFQTLLLRSIGTWGVTICAASGLVCCIFALLDYRKLWKTHGKAAVSKRHQLFSLIIYTLILMAVTIFLSILGQMPQWERSKDTNVKALVPGLLNLGLTIWWCWPGRLKAYRDPPTK